MGYLKEKIRLFCSIPYVLYLLVIHKQPRRVIIYYHSVKKHQVDKFEKQMAYLADKCFVTKPSEIMNEPPDGSKIVVAITFDDAFTSVMDNSVPILRKYGFSAGIFVPTRYLGRAPGWSLDKNCPEVDEIVMNEQQVAELDRVGFEIFSHTVSHPVLTNINDGMLEAELVNSKKTLERIIGHHVRGISYPHGAYNARVCEAARKAGYKLGFTIEPGLIDSFTDDLRIGRTLVSPDDNLTKFKLKVNGAYQATRCLKAIKRMVVRK